MTSYSIKMTYIFNYDDALILFLRKFEHASLSRLVSGFLGHVIYDILVQRENVQGRQLIGDRGHHCIIIWKYRLLYGRLETVPCWAWIDSTVGFIVF